MTITEISELGERYYEVYINKYGEDDYDEVYLVYGDLENAMESIEWREYEPDASDYYACICYAGQDLVLMPNCADAYEYEMILSDHDVLCELMSA